MNLQSTETEITPHALAIRIWENEGGALDRNSMDSGSRVEADGSGSINHVFTGVPAEIGGHSMTGLSRSGATEGMMSLNLRNKGGRRDLHNAGWLKDPNRLIALGPRHREIDEVWL